MPDFQRQTVQLLQWDNSRVPVPALVHNGLAVHRRSEATGRTHLYTVTHVHSGIRFAEHPMTMRVALSYAVELSARIDAEQDIPAAVNDIQCDALRAAARAAYEAIQHGMAKMKGEKISLCP